MEENKKIRSGNYINNVEIQLAGMYINKMDINCV